VVFPDVCAKYKGQTCIALGIGCDDDLQVDQLDLQSTTPGLLPGGDVRAPSTPRTLSLPAVVAILPDASFAGGAFTITLDAYFRGNRVVSGFSVGGSVPLGGTVKVNADHDSQVCLINGSVGPCNGCPGCCINGTCIQQFQACGSGTLCVLSPSGNGNYSCVACGGVGQLCCEGATCDNGCCSSGNPGGSCVPVNSICSTNQVPLYCLNQAGAKPGCLRCGDRDDPCCPDVDGGMPRCAANGCCDPVTNICVVAGGSCEGENLSCQSHECAACGGSGEVCCPPAPGLPGGPVCVSGTCNGTTCP
jgi:hypothetical protein